MRTQVLTGFFLKMGSRFFERGYSLIALISIIVSDCLSFVH